VSCWRSTDRHYSSIRATLSAKDLCYNQYALELAKLEALARLSASVRYGVLIYRSLILILVLARHTATAVTKSRTGSLERELLAYAPVLSKSSGSEANTGLHRYDLPPATRTAVCYRTEHLEAYEPRGGG
jgi:hypothetical protein